MIDNQNKNANTEISKKEFVRSVLWPAVAGAILLKFSEKIFLLFNGEFEFLELIFLSCISWYLWQQWVDHRYGGFNNQERNIDFEIFHIISIFLTVSLFGDLIIFLLSVQMYYIFTIFESLYVYRKNSCESIKKRALRVCLVNATGLSILVVGGIFLFYVSVQSVNIIFLEIYQNELLQWLCVSSYIVTFFLWIKFVPRIN